ncbi:MAG: hypothetical protein AABY18_07155 [Candidatus Thermoplasmatota archaeon]
MRNLALLTFAGLAAVTLVALPASALCAVEADGGCSGIAAPAVSFDVRSDCADAAGGLCLADDGNASNILAGNDLHLNVTNHHGQSVDFEVFIIQRVDDAVDDSGQPLRVRADRIAVLEDVAAGETRYANLAIDGNTSMLRFQALSADAKHAELDVQAMHVMSMTGGAPEVDPAQDASDDAESDGKDAPYLGIVALVGVLAAIVGLRRYD